MTNVTLDDLSFKVKIGSRTLTYTYAENPDNFEKAKTVIGISILTVFMQIK